MERHEHVRKMVVDAFSFRQDYPTARELYYVIRKNNPGKLQVTFKSFVKIVNAFPEVKGERPSKGSPMIYKAVKFK
jgi:hypothetical protein